jgi:hypothetical protein
LSTLNRWEQRAPGTAAAYLRGPFGSLIWTALTTDDFRMLWTIVEAHVPAVSDLRRRGTPFERIVDIAEQEARRAPYVDGEEWAWGAYKPPVRKLLRLGKTADSNPFCAVSALVALLRIASEGQHPDLKGRLAYLVNILALERIRGVASEAFPVNAMTYLLGLTEEASAYAETQWEKVFGTWTLRDFKRA